MNLTERQLGRIEACLWGIEEATKNTNQTAYRLAKGIAEQLQEAETDAQPEEDFREDLTLQPESMPDVPDWRDGEGEERNDERGEMKEERKEWSRVNFLRKEIQAYWQLHRLEAGPVDLLWKIKREFRLTEQELGDLLGIKKTSMCRILHGGQRNMMLARTTELFGEGSDKSDGSDGSDRGEE